MAIIYSYPGLPFKDLTGDDLFIITDVDSTTDNPTRSISLDNVVKYMKESAGSGVGTINRIPKFKNTGTTTLEDSILLQNTLATSVAVDGDLTFADNKKILLGGSSDLQLYHNATDSLIENITGDIDIINKATDKNVTIQATSDHTGTDVTDQYLALLPTFISTATNPGALFIYKDVLMASDDLKIRMGANQDLEIYHDATDSRIINIGGDYMPKVLMGWIKYCLLTKFGAPGMVMDNNTMEYLKWNIETELHRLVMIGDLYKDHRGKWKVNLRIM